MSIARLGFGTVGTLRTQLVLALTLALSAVAVPYPDAAVKANGATGISTTTVTADVNPSVTGQTVTFTATVGGPITDYTGPGISGPAGIAVGPDGALWFTNINNDSIGRITTDGVVTNYTDAGIDAPYSIIAGPDGNLWFTSHDNNKIGRITTAGAITLYSDATRIGGPYAIAAGSDGAIWFANGGLPGQTITKRSIGTITTAGVVSYYPAPGGSPWSCPGLTDLVCEPTGIAAGPDSALWFTNSGTSTIGRITTGGALSMYGGTGVSTPLYITAGPDSALWFTNIGNNSIGRAATDGTITNYPSGTISGPRVIATGSDGNLWFGNQLNNSIGRITPAGVVTSYTAASVLGPYGVVSGPDGAIWFTNSTGNSIGRINPAGPASGTPTGSVQFNIDGTNVGSPVALNGSGQAQLALDTLPPFFHTVAAIYSGDGNFLPSASTNYAQAVALTADLPAGGTLTTSPEATPDFPFALSLTSPNAGTVTIGIQPVTGTAPSGFSYLGYELVITAPAATAANPLVLVFQIDASLLAGQNVADIVVNRNGTVIPNCTAADATPDPCVASRVLLPSGDAQITGRTSHVSTWTFATPTAAADTTPPYTGYVEVGLLTGGQVNSSTLLVSWSASDDVTPASDLVHKVQVRRLKHGIWGPWFDVASVTGSQLATFRPTWRNYQYRVQTRDQAGNWGAWEESDHLMVMRRHDRHFRRNGGWTTVPAAGAMGGKVAQSSTIGSWARLRFWGSGVALVMPAGGGLGTIEVCLDAGTAAQRCQNVDLSTFSPSGPRRLVAVFNELTFGLHHLLVRVTGGTVDLDGALVIR